MTDATLVNTDTLPTLSEDAMRTAREGHIGYDGDPYRNTHWLSEFSGPQFYHWTQVADTTLPQTLARIAGNVVTNLPTMALSIYHEALNENARRDAESNPPALFEDDIEAEIRAAFPGAIPDDKLAKLRALVTERNNLRAQASAPITPRDPRLMEHWAKVAEAATAAGYCSEYDRMSEAGDFPTREELRRGGYLTAPTGQAYGYVTVTIQRRVNVSVPFENVSEDRWDDAREAFSDENGDIDWDELVDDEVPSGWELVEVTDQEFSTYEMD